MTTEEQMVILHVLTHFRRILNHRNSEVLQFGDGTNTRMQKDMGGADGASGQNDLVLSFDLESWLYAKVFKAHISDQSC